MTVGRGGKSLQLTSEGVFKTLKTIAENRGRKVCEPYGLHDLDELLIETAFTRRTSTGLRPSRSLLDFWRSPRPLTRRSESSLQSSPLVLITLPV
jgi:hypothetical protein